MEIFSQKLMEKMDAQFSDGDFWKIEDIEVHFFV